MRSVAADTAWAAHEVAHPSRNWHELCYAFVHDALDVPAKYSSAIVGWSHVHPEDRHGGSPPEGVPGFFAIGRYGHAVYCLGGGWCDSTDIFGNGRVWRCKLSDITQHWGAKWLGWTETINDVRVYHPTLLAPIHAAPVVSLAEAQAEARKGTFTNAAIAAALKALDLPATRAGYSDYQKKSGYSGQQADGIPGSITLHALGAAHGFAVTS